MKTRIYKTVAGMASQTKQLTAQEVLDGRFCHIKHGWINCKLELDAMEVFFQDMLAIIGGKKRNVVSTAIRYRRPNHWTLKRIIWSNGHWQYYAGQDYTSELNQLRKYLYNL